MAGMMKVPAVGGVEKNSNVKSRESGKERKEDWGKTHRGEPPIS